MSVLLGQRQAFMQQALQVERLPPIGISTLTESDGHLWHAGYSCTDRVPSLARDMRTFEFLKDHPTELGAMAHAVGGLLDPAHPQLASRWAMALDWGSAEIRVKMPHRIRKTSSLHEVAR